MRRLPLLFACLLAPLSLGGCARHVVVERSFGRIDSKRSISTNSDQQWTISHEPAEADEKH